MTSVGENIKNIRKKNNITQEELAKNLSVTRQAVSSWESGERVPQLDNVIQFLKIFNVKFEQVNWLKTDSGKTKGRKK